jgi:type IV secretion system protein VirB1
MTLRGCSDPTRRGAFGEYSRLFVARLPIATAVLGAIAGGSVAHAQAQYPVQAQYAPQSFEALAARCAPSVHLRTLSAVVMQESRGYQYAIGINGGGRLPRQPINEAEAIATARWLLRNGYNFDAGLGQINSKNFGALGLSPDTLFEPCTNLKSAATILSQCYAKSLRSYGGQSAIHGALSCYNTGNLRRGFANGYVRKVVGQVSLPVPALLGSAPPRSAPAPTRRSSGEVVAANPVDDPVQLAAQPNAHTAPHEGMGDAFSRGPRDAFTPAPPPPAPEDSYNEPVHLTASAESL